MRRRCCGGPADTTDDVDAASDGVEEAGRGRNNGEARDREERGGWLMEEGARHAWPWGLGSLSCVREEGDEWR